MGQTFKDAFDLLLRIQSSKAPNTYAQSKAIVANLEWFQLNHPDLERFETEFEEIWSEYKSWCQKNRPGKKLGHARRYLVQALRRAHKRGWIKKAFAKTDFDLMEFSEPIGKHIPQEKIELMKDFLRANHEKTYLQVLIASTVGMRISEILHLRKQEVDLEKKEINLDPSRLKTRRARKVPIPIVDDVYPLLKSFYEAAQGDFIFPSVKHGSIDWTKPQRDNSYWWRKARKHANVKCRFHDLRHSAASNALAAGMPDFAVCQIFGMTQQVLAQIYAHLREQDREKYRSILNGKKPDAK